jgi:isoleucyl-tRNA synthetase
VNEWLEIDRYALAMTHTLQADIAAAYAAYDFHTVTQRLQAFCSEDLGGFYLDILKDRLYTAGKDSAARRSAQNALYHITQSLHRLMAPVLSFTAEEVHEVLTGRDDASVFIGEWYDLPKDEVASLVSKWTLIRSVRGWVSKFLEQLRSEGSIGSSLQADVLINVFGDTYDALYSLGDELRFVLIVSSATLTKSENVGVNTQASSHTKCDRCWHYRADVGSDAQHPTLCARCVSNLLGAGEVRRYA